MFDLLYLLINLNTALIGNTHQPVFRIITKSRTIVVISNRTNIELPYVCNMNESLLSIYFYTFYESDVKRSNVLLRVNIDIPHKHNTHAHAHADAHVRTRKIVTSIRTLVDLLPV